MQTEASLNYILGSISECSARALAKHLSNRRSTYAIICNMPTLSHTFLASLHEGFSDLPKHKRVSGHPQLLLQSLLRVSVRPTTSFYRGFQCDPQLPFIEGFSATHNFPLSRVSVRPTTSFYLIIFYSSLLLQLTQSYSSIPLKITHAQPSIPMQITSPVAHRRSLHVSSQSSIGT